jgi:H+/Cl- antiporter ClcA
MKRTATVRFLLGILALGVWVLAASALALVYFFLIFIHKNNGGDFNDLASKSHLLGLVLLLPSAGLIWGAYALSRKALGS